MMTEPVRAFIALKIPDSVLDRMRKVQTGIRRHGFGIRWVRPENMHLTLKFLGDIGMHQKISVESAMGDVAEKYSPFDLKVKGVGLFPGSNRPRVIWMGLVGETRPLLDMQKALDNRLAQFGFKKDTRPFMAHLTLGRIKKPIDSKKLVKSMEKFQEFSSDRFSVDRIHLIKSVLRPSGPDYTPMYDKIFIGTPRSV